MNRLLLTVVLTNTFTPWDEAFSYKRSKRSMSFKRTLPKIIKKRFCGNTYWLYNDTRTFFLVIVPVTSNCRPVGKRWPFQVSCGRSDPWSDLMRKLNLNIGKHISTLAIHQRIQKLAFINTCSKMWDPDLGTHQKAARHSNLLCSNKANKNKANAEEAKTEVSPMATWD